MPGTWRFDRPTHCGVEGARAELDRSPRHSREPVQDPVSQSAHPGWRCFWLRVVGVGVPDLPELVDFLEQFPSALLGNLPFVGVGSQAHYGSSFPWSADCQVGVSLLSGGVTGDSTNGAHTLLTLFADNRRCAAMGGCVT